MNSLERVKKYLAAYDLADDVRELDQDTATVATAAKALCVEESRIAKSLSFKTPDGGCLLLVAAGDAKVDNRRFKERFGFKAKMPKGPEVEDLTGHAIGGVCPFALKESVDVYLDTSLERFQTIFPACGSANSMISISPEMLKHVAQARDVVDVCNGWRVEKT